jgi:hypothetical protein
MFGRFTLLMVAINVYVCDVWKIYTANGCNKCKYF